MEFTYGVLLYIFFEYLNQLQSHLKCREFKGKCITTETIDSEKPQKGALEEAT